MGRDRIAKRLHVADKGYPDINCGRWIVTPEIITFHYWADAEPVNGIYPHLTEVEGPNRGVHPGSHGPARSTEWFRRTHPHFWPAWLIDLGNQHRP